MCNFNTTKTNLGLILGEINRNAGTLFLILIAQFFSFFALVTINNPPQSLGQVSSSKRK